MNEITQRLLRRVQKRARSRRGQTLVEYALILCFISVVAIASLLSMGTQVKGAFSTVTSQLATASTAGAASGGSGGSGGGSGNRGG
jgi:Flp pilus assembly pilin Flp